MRPLFIPFFVRMLITPSLAPVHQTFCQAMGELTAPHKIYQNVKLNALNTQVKVNNTRPIHKKLGSLTFLRPHRCQTKTFFQKKLATMVLFNLGRSDIYYLYHKLLTIFLKIYKFGRLVFGHLSQKNIILCNSQR